MITLVMRFGCSSEPLSARNHYPSMLRRHIALVGCATSELFAMTANTLRGSRVCNCSASVFYKHSTTGRMRCQRPSCHLAATDFEGATPKREESRSCTSPGNLARTSLPVQLALESCAKCPLVIRDVRCLRHLPVAVM